MGVGNNGSRRTQQRHSRLHTAPDASASQSGLEGVECGRTTLLTILNFFPPHPYYLPHRQLKHKLFPPALLLPPMTTNTTILLLALICICAFAASSFLPTLEHLSPNAISMPDRPSRTITTMDLDAAVAFIQGAQIQMFQNHFQLL